jgi:hypothetical protein
VSKTEKRCTTCGETKPLSEFSKDKGSKDGLHFYCKACAHAAEKKWRSVPGRNRHKDLLRELKHCTPKWADRARIRDKYEQSSRLRVEFGATDLHVDHIIPIKAKDAAGKWVASGLHCPDNLQIIGGFWNTLKGSKDWEREMKRVYGAKYWMAPEPEDVK